ncbi:RNA ligase/cyclic nucleotide phosphodiesterase [Xylaria cubensis]|nr:RNA ligase/cyclic nucleotide phosphodiesterase [Xylaria cubensis]
MGSILESTDIKNKLIDLSGVVVEVQALYAAHRTRRNAQQKEKFLDADFKELIIDPYLLRLEHSHVEPGFKDVRNCMTFWGRPPIHVLELAGVIQQKLKEVAPSELNSEYQCDAKTADEGAIRTVLLINELRDKWNIWLMPQHRMHITTLELAFSRTPDEIEQIKETLKPAIPTIASYTYRHRARLVKPMISYDLSAFALSFLPAAGEPVVSPAPAAPDSAAVLKQGDRYSYHHLRRDMWEQAKEAGITVDSRYVVPSAHITLGRYLTHEDHATPEQRKKWVDAIDNVNEWLEREVWGKADSKVIGEWVVGQEKGIDVRVGTLW